jgi:alanine racemase
VGAADPMTDVAKHAMDDGKIDPLSFFHGREVELLSQDPSSPCAVPAMAAAAGSSPYEILSRLSANLTRKYVAAEAQ